MKPQNIFDNEVFFQGYKRLRENPKSANIMEEKPAIFSLLPMVFLFFSKNIPLLPHRKKVPGGLFWGDKH